ncbi:MAG: hypothetical protein QXH12_01175 [Candidatus Caldarchaeum sp.]|uniref:Uncharacterized protein n=1 Tax=Caldiarchaeum subterraneum TaxID=311458 RepID=A0A7C5LA08_CALS0
MLRCVCGTEINYVDDLEFSQSSNGVVRARCRNRFCRLEEVVEVVMRDKAAEVKFSCMFSDYNLLFMGSDMLEKSLKDFGSKMVRMLSGGKSLKTRVTTR